MQKIQSKGPIYSILAVSLIAIIFLFWLIYFIPKSENYPNFVNYLPALNAFLNSLSAIFLLIGVYAIKRLKNRQKHLQALTAAFIFSSLFLLSYIIYHYYHGDSKFLATGIIRPFYFFILISHILISIIALPMVLSTYYFGITDQKERHKKLAPWTFAAWLYVSVTGVLIFMILKIFQPAIV